MNTSKKSIHEIDNPTWVSFNRKENFIERVPLKVAFESLQNLDVTGQNKVFLVCGLMRGIVDYEYTLKRVPFDAKEPKTNYKTEKFYNPPFKGKTKWFVFRSVFDTIIGSHFRFYFSSESFVEAINFIEQELIEADEYYHKEYSNIFNRSSQPETKKPLININLPIPLKKVLSPDQIRDIFREINTIEEEEIFDVNADQALLERDICEYLICNDCYDLVAKEHRANRNFSKTFDNVYRYFLYSFEDLKKAYDDLIHLDKKQLKVLDIYPVVNEHDSHIYAYIDSDSMEDDGDLQVGYMYLSRKEVENLLVGCKNCGAYREEISQIKETKGELEAIRYALENLNYEGNIAISKHIQLISVFQDPFFFHIEDIPMCSECNKKCCSAVDMAESFWRNCENDERENVEVLS